MRTRRCRKNDWPKIKEIVEILSPKWFDAEAVKNVPKDIQLCECLVVENEGKILGFVSFYSQDGKARIGWLGVDLLYRHGGVGSLLIKAVEKRLGIIGIDEVEVETVIEQAPPDGSYDETMKFYKAMNFEVKKRSGQKKYRQYVYRMGMLKKRIK